MGRQRCSDPVDALISALADRQHGVVARRQLVELGVSDRAIHARLPRRLLVPLHRGVYAFGHDKLTLEGRWLAAVLAAGSGAVLSHRDAAALHGMRKPPESRKVSVSTPSAAKGTPRLWVYGRRQFHDEDVTVVKGIPTTSPARTLVDLAPMLTAGQLQATIGEADRRGLLDVGATERALRRTKGRHGQGHRRLLAALEAHEQRGITLLRSELEERFLDLVIAASLPTPALNAPAAGFEVDALWRDERLAVELDSWAHHKEREAAAWDREKSNRLQNAGYRVLRFMHGDLVRRPQDVAAQIRNALER
jgi:REase_MTES_1575/Transcriptional regulator, AbiEi antitoxin